MGWFAYVPFMECYHGVLSLDHEVNGRLRLGKRETDFSGGRGYIEKDWAAPFRAGGCGCRPTISRKRAPA
jgi:tocopherol cyclase